MLADNPKTTDLHVLVYVSTAVHLLSLAEIDHLLDRAQARNSKAAVTGVLLYNEGNFIQYLEGPPSGVSKIYELIKADPLHHGIIELLREPIQTRVFSEWPMAFRCSQKFNLPQRMHLNEQLSQRLALAIPPVSTAHMLLTKIWNSGT